MCLQGDPDPRSVSSKQDSFHTYDCRLIYMDTMSVIYMDTMSVSSQQEQSIHF